MRRIGAKIAYSSSAFQFPAVAVSTLTSSSSLVSPTTPSERKNSYTPLSFSQQRRAYASLAGPRNLSAETKEITDACAPLWGKLPEDGSTISAADFSALVDEEFPSRAYNAIGLYTVREIAEACPSMFRVDSDPESGWYSVARVENATAAAAAANATTDGGDDGAVAPPSIAPATVSAPSASKDASKYVSVKGSEYARLEDVLTKEADGVPIDAVLRYLHTNTSFKVRTLVTIAPKAKPHGAHVLVDGDGLSKDTVNTLFATLKLTTVASTRTVIRQAAAHPHGANDLICKTPAQTFQILENQLDQLTAGSAVLLKPIVIMCSEAQRSVYAAVARKYGSKMDIMLATPSTVGHVESATFAFNASTAVIGKE